MLIFGIKVVLLQACIFFTRYSFIMRNAELDIYIVPQCAI